MLNFEGFSVLFNVAQEVKKYEKKIRTATLRIFRKTKAKEFICSFSDML